MAFTDFLKKTADTVTKKAQDVVQSAGEVAKDVTGRAMQTVFALAYEKEREERRKKLEGYKQTPPSCKQGDCTMCYEAFVYSCPKDCACERKDAVDVLHLAPVLRPEYLAYAKWMEEVIGSNKILLEASGVPAEEIDSGAILDMADYYFVPSHFPKGNALPEKFTDGVVPVSNLDEVTMAFIENEFPDFCDAMYYLLVGGILTFSLMEIGFGAHNKLLQFLIRAHECKLDVKRCPKRFLRHLATVILPLNKKDEFPVEMYVDVTRDVYYSPTFYDMPEDKLIFMACWMEYTLNQTMFEMSHPDIPYDYDKLLSLFVDENGNFHPKQDALNALIEDEKQTIHKWKQSHEKESTKDDMIGE